MRSGFFIVGLGKALNEILENVAHIDGSHIFGGEIGFIGIEVRDDLIKQATFHHTIDLCRKIHAGKDILHIVRKAVQIGFEIVFDIFWVSNQCLEREFASIIELITGSLLQKAILNSQFLDFGISFQHLLLCRQQAVMESLDDRHRQDY